MTTHVVIDTNVLVVANGGHEAAGLSCVDNCIAALIAARNATVIVDDGYRMFEQYRQYCSHAGQPGVGDAFFKWLWDYQGMPATCMQVAVSRIGPEPTDFAEFPQDQRLAQFDPADRVFVAVAIASGVKPPILNASDTDWWNARTALAENGIEVQFLCPELMRWRR